MSQLPTYITRGFLRRLGACDTTLCIFGAVFGRKSVRMNSANLTKFLMRWCERTDYSQGWSLIQLAGMLRAGRYWSPDLTLKYQVDCAKRYRPPKENAQLFVKYWGMARREQRRR
jgi:hypothetical protein